MSAPSRKRANSRFHVWQALFGVALVVLGLCLGLVVLLAFQGPQNGPLLLLKKAYKASSTLGLSAVAILTGLKKYVPEAWKRSASLPAPHWSAIEAGLYGGLVGGLFAGVIIGISYYFQNLTPSGQHADAMMFPMTVGFAAVAGAVGGSSIQAGMKRLRGWEIAGATLYGAPAIGCVGAFGGWYFGKLDGDFVGTGTVLWPVALGVVCLLLGILSSEFHSWGEFARGVVVTALVSITLGMLAAPLLAAMHLERYFVTPGVGASEMMWGGLWFGLGLGILCGVDCGLTLVLYRKWR